MRQAETVTFGGGGLDRAAALRSAPERLAKLRVDPGAQVLALWRGKILRNPAGSLGLLAPDHPAVGESVLEPLFLGLKQGNGVFAQDISAWEPASEAPPPEHVFLDATLQHHPALPADWAFAELRAMMTALTPWEAEVAASARALTGWHQTHRFCSACGSPSAVAMAGWQRTCPECGAHHFPRTDPVVIMLVTSGNAILVGRSPGWPEGMYSLLAGFVEPGEALESAVRREVFEEVGVRIGRVRYLASQPWPFPANLMIGCHGDALDRQLTLDPAEIEDALWLTREEMAGVLQGDHPRIKPARRGAIAHFLIEAWLADRLD